MSAADRGREPRAYLVVRDRNPLLRVEARPGQLRSMAAPPEGWVPPTHPFVDAASMDPVSESELRDILDASASFADFMARLVAAGCDLMSASNDTWDLPPVRRIRADGGRVVGALWAQAGQFASLEWQPEADADVYPHALVTAYAADLADALHGALASTRTLAELEAVLGGLGLTLG
ncbi:MAG: hypothetical protein U1F43_21405 [Myxococcota bacterium]